MGITKRQHAPVAMSAERRHDRDMLTTTKKKTYKVILEEVKAAKKKLITLVCAYPCLKNTCSAMLTVSLLHLGLVRGKTTTWVYFHTSGRSQFYQQMQGTCASRWLTGLYCFGALYSLTASDHQPLTMPFLPDNQTQKSWDSI